MLNFYPLSAQLKSKISERLLYRTQSADGLNYLVWIELTDKPDITLNKDFSSNSLVAQKSIDRRKKVLSPDKVFDYTDLPVNNRYIDELTSIGVKVRHKSRWFNAVSALVTRKQLRSIINLPFVKTIDEVAALKAGRQIEARNKIYKTSTALQPANAYSFDYGNSFTQLNQINVPALHNMGFTGEGVVIAVLDAGFNNLPHEVFQHMNIIAKWDFVNNDPGVGDSTDQGGGSHGTATLSTIGGFKPGMLIGPAFNSKYILAKTENTYSETPIEEDNWIAAIEWADSIGVDITSTSLGYLDFNAPFTSYTWQNMDGNTCRITKAADLAVKKGIAVFNSAGNEGGNADHNTLCAPADGDSVITIGAVDASNNRCSFSSVGNTVDGRTKPDLMAMGDLVVTASPLATNEYFLSAGTSFSCPLAAGVGALILSARPFLTPMQLRDALRSTASKHFFPNREYGWGIINALSALQYAPVPVELTSFSAKVIGQSVQLVWRVNLEGNIDGFEIQRSFDNIEFSKIGFIKASISEPIEKGYSYSDIAPNRKDYYRLKTILRDGSYNYSNVIEVNSEVYDFALLQNYPNPFNPDTKIRYHIPANGYVSLKIFDSIGNLLCKLVSEVKPAGSYESVWQPGDAASGVYLCELTYGQKREIRKMIYLR